MATPPDACVSETEYICDGVVGKILGMKSHTDNCGFSRKLTQVRLGFPCSFEGHWAEESRIGFSGQNSNTNPTLHLKMKNKKVKTYLREKKERRGGKLFSLKIQHFNKTMARCQNLQWL